jgi:hypothetical protein
MWKPQNAYGKQGVISHSEETRKKKGTEGKVFGIPNRVKKTE